MKNLEKQAIGIVAQLFDLAEVPVDKRQEINDVAYDYVTEQLIITDVGCSLPKVCTGCGSLSTKVIDKKYLACCPDNQYIKLEDYCKKSVYKPELFNK